MSRERMKTFFMIFVSLAVLVFAIFVNYQTEKTLDEVEVLLQDLVPPPDEKIYHKTVPGFDETILHPIYGSYPEEVPFEQGMTIYPGQSAILEIPFEVTGDTTDTRTELIFN